MKNREAIDELEKACRRTLFNLRHKDADAKTIATAMKMSAELVLVEISKPESLAISSATGLREVHRREVETT